MNFEGSRGSSLGLIKPLSLLILSVAVLPCLCGFPLNWGVLGYFLLYIGVGTRKRSDRMDSGKTRRVGHVSGRIFGRSKTSPFFASGHRCWIRLRQILEIRVEYPSVTGWILGYLDCRPPGAGR